TFRINILNDRYRVNCYQNCHFERNEVESRNLTNALNQIFPRRLPGRNDNPSLSKKNFGRNLNLR
ncbi:MAG: hypothetical protein ACE5HO_19635, partial [bacterium]